MTFSMCHCWSRTSSGRRRWIRTQRNQTPVTMSAVSTRWRQFVTARSMQESQRVIYQGSTIWVLGKVIQKKKIPGSLIQRSNTLGNLSARSTKTILTSQQQPLWPSILHHRWLGQLSSQQPSQRLNQRQRNENKANQLIVLTNELKGTELHLVFIVFLAFS